jgi:hypothetical protein
MYKLPVQKEVLRSLVEYAIGMVKPLIRQLSTI